jgi:hypothetical protein
MSITVYSEDQWFQNLIASFTAQFPNVDLSQYGFMGLLSRSVAQAGASISLAIEDADNQSPPAYDMDADGNIRSRCNRSSLEAWAFTFGLPNGVGGYGARGATISTGGSAVPTGVATTFVPAGTQASDVTGQVFVQTTADLTLTGTPNTVSVPLVATP